MGGIVPTSESKKEKLLLILPCWNEEESLGTLLPETLKTFRASQILVIDDGSRDRTSAVADEFGVLRVTLVRNCGIGGAMQCGFIYAVRNGFDYAVQVDGDGQHPPEQALRLLEASSGDNDIVIGSRFAGEDSFRSSVARRTGIKIISSALRLLFGLRVKDVTSGMRLYGKNALKIFSERYPADYPEPLALALAREQGIELREVPVVMRERQGGASSIVGLHTLRYMVRVIGNLILLRLGRHF